jgi:hypothetical protein
MRPSRTLDIGWEAHQDAIAVASIAQAHGAEVSSLGAIGTRQCAIDQLLRNMPSKAPHLILVDAAGPCGSWRYRYVTQKGFDGWGGGPLTHATKGR